MLASNIQKKYGYLKGKRIHLIRMDNDDAADLQASRMKNQYGIVKYVDNMGQLHIDWENHHGDIAVIPYLDEWELAE